MFTLDMIKIRNLMFALQLNGRTLAKKAGLAPLTIGKIIRGQTKVTAQTVGKLAQALGVNGEDILSLS